METTLFPGYRFARMLTGFAGIALILAGAVQAAPPDRHAWKTIEYPMLPVPGVESEKLTVMVGSGAGDEVSRLRFDVLWSGYVNVKMPPPIADARKITVRLHLSDGKVVQPEDKNPQSWVKIVMTGGQNCSLTYTFPWSRNALEEAWVELGVPGQTYWIELPYGFTRKPSDPLIADPEHGEPVFPPTMKKLGKNDRLVPWLSVEYDLGEIQNHWQLSLRLGNPFDAAAEAILYGVSDLHTPRTSMTIQMPGGRFLTGQGVSISRQHEGRNDEFSFNRNGWSEKGREWGKAVIKVDDKTYECVVPSSLFKYVHGVTDNENTKRLPRPKSER